MKAETRVSIGGALVGMVVGTAILDPLGIVYHFVLAVIGGAVVVTIYKVGKSLKS